MNTRFFVRTTLAAGIGAAGMYLVRHRRRWAAAPHAATPAPQAQHLLTRAAPYLRLPTSPHQPPKVLPDGSGLRCSLTGRVYPYRDGVLDVLADTPTLTDTQHVLNTSATAWLYDHGRDAFMRLVGMPTFAMEVATIHHQLQVQPGDVLLDLACGHGNFTTAWATRAGSHGLVVGVDISTAMLARAARRVTRHGLHNVLLIRGDAQHLPFADHSFSKVNCSGGFHQLPDLSRALQEIARISASRAVLTASTFAEGPNDRAAPFKHWLKRRFALHFVPLTWLGQQLARVGYHDYRWSLPGGWFGYTAACKAAGSSAPKGYLA